MGLWIRELNDSNGDLVERITYCSEGCAANDEEFSDVGEAFHPQGYETDYPEFCHACGDAVSTSLTPNGESYLLEMIRKPHSLTPRQMESLHTEYSEVIDAAA